MSDIIQSVVEHGINGAENIAPVFTPLIGLIIGIADSWLDKQLADGRGESFIGYKRSVERLVTRICRLGNALNRVKNPGQGAAKDLMMICHEAKDIVDAFGKGGRLTRWAKRARKSDALISRVQLALSEISSDLQLDLGLDARDERELMHNDLRDVKASLESALNDAKASAKELAEKNAALAAVNAQLARLEDTNGGPRGVMSVIRRSEIEMGEVIGRGGFGEVRKGIYHGQTVAVKTCISEPSQDSNSIAQQMMAEAMTLGQLHHPCIVRLYGFVSEASMHALVMEYVEGGSLSDLLYKRGVRLDVRSALCIGKELMSALAYMHDRNVLHRDVKSGNVLLGSDLRVRLADMGLAKSVVAGGGAVSVVGAPAWSAPEMLDVRKSNDEKGAGVDVYSWAIVMSEMLSGNFPYADLGGFAANQAGIVTKGVRPSLPSDLDGEIRELVEECWDGDALKRPSAKTVMNRLELLGAKSRRVGGSDRSFGSRIATSLSPSAVEAWVGGVVGSGEGRRGSGSKSGSGGSGVSSRMSVAESEKSRAEAAEAAKTEAEARMKEMEVKMKAMEAALSQASKGGKSPAAVVMKPPKPSKSSVKLLSEEELKSKLGASELGGLAICRAARHGDELAVRSLIALGVDVDAKGIFGDTPLHEACSNGHVDVARMLLSVFGSNSLDAKNDDGYTPLHNACFADHVEVVRYLISAGASPNSKNTDRKYPRDLTFNSAIQSVVKAAGGKRSNIVWRALNT